MINDVRNIEQQTLKKKNFFSKLMDNLDQKLEAKSKDKKCCCCEKNKCSKK